MCPGVDGTFDATARCGIPNVQLESDMSQDYQEPFSISPPDRDGVVWLCDATGRRLKLGPEDVVVEQVTRFLRAIDDARLGGENPTRPATT